MAGNSWFQLVPPTRIVNGSAFNTFTSYQSISPAPDIKIGANGLTVGQKIRLLARGEFSNTGTPTLSIGFFWGAAGVPLGQSALITTTTGATNWPWILEYDGTVRAIGTAGSIWGMGIISLGTSLTAMTTQFTPTTLALRTSAIDTTIEKVVGVGAQWGTSNAANTITVNDFEVWTKGAPL